MPEYPDEDYEDDNYSDDISEVTQNHIVIQASIDHHSGEETERVRAIEETPVSENPRQNLVRINNLDPGRMSNVMTLNPKVSSISGIAVSQRFANNESTLSASGLTRLVELTPRKFTGVPEKLVPESTLTRTAIESATLIPQQLLAGNQTDDNKYSSHLAKPSSVDGDENEHQVDDEYSDVEENIVDTIIEEEIKVDVA